jgi:cytochrome c5
MNRYFLRATTKRNHHSSYRGMLLVFFMTALSTATYAHGETQELYSQACATCHEAGVLGAPKMGDKAAWGARMKAQGLPTLVKHVKEGYKNMPARGLCNTCTDTDFTNLIQYMASK